MRVLLVNPSTDHMIKTHVPMEIETEAGLQPPLGLLYISAYLRANTPHDVKVIDLQLSNTPENDLSATIASFHPDVVGITTTTFNLIDTVAAARLIKKLQPETRIIVGGPHTSIFPDETIALDCVDGIVIGEGEIAFTELIDNLEHPEIPAAY